MSAPVITTLRCSVRNRSILEIGCGQGVDADVMTRYCRRYVGVDLSEQSIEIARREVGKRQPIRARPIFLTADAEALPFHDQQFDMVYSVGVLHHTPDFLAAILEAHRVLEPDGALVLMLYRSYTPLWLVLRTLRGALCVPLIGPWVKNKIIGMLRTAKSGEGGSSTGTAFVELVGCPIIDTYTLRGLRRIFDGRFVIEDADCYRVGFDQIVRCTPSFFRSIWPQRWMTWCEERLRRWLGFYLVVTARKLGESTA
ncbi:MAG: class I SAM-dependent methyltransferase [Planctomycetes bacterium]|nr:class I SAM-dependent methyltransferase [Planctomycetota bacterium]